MAKWNLYTAKEIRPLGWLKRQLEIQAEGLSGNLDKVWPDVRDSAWIGGDREGWERVPYWLDGFIPLAYLLENEDMIARAKKYIDAILVRQRPDGWICPCKDEERRNYDSWAVQLIAKVLTVYYECSGDERIPDVIYRVMRNYYELLKSGEIFLQSWGESRWFETMIPIRFLYERCGESWLKELAVILEEQGKDYSAVTDTWIRPLNKWTHHTHIVNMGMMLKSEAVCCELTGAPYTDLAERLHNILSTYNGTPVGLFTGDECLSGLSPIQGTELCAVVEQMYSYELLYACTGDSKWAERLELLAFNALPATISDDMWTHQYVQMSNQIACQRFPGRSQFRTNGPEAHLFGLEPNYGCCTANFNQGWPKFALSAFMHRGAEVVSAVPVPSELRTADQYIRLETNYPFENSFRYHVEAASSFTLKIRIPSFAQKALVDGKPVEAGMASVEFKAGECRDVTVSYETVPHFEARPHGLQSVKCGSLVFSVPIRFEKKMYEYEHDGVERKFPYCDYELIPQSDWNYGFSDMSLCLERNPIGTVPFSGEQPPVVIRSKVKKINWGLEDGFETVCAKKPESLEPISEELDMTLYPYGCAKLRMTELPLLKD